MPRSWTPLKELTTLLRPLASSKKNRKRGKGNKINKKEREKREGEGREKLLQWLKRTDALA